MWQNTDTCEGFINVKMLLHVLTLQTAPIVCISAIFLYLDFCKPHMFCNIPASLHVNKDIPSLPTLASGNNKTDFT